MLTITQVKQLLHDYGLKVNKRLGQNFLIDKNIVDKIIRIADISGNDVILEIGAGLGNITRDIAALADRVIAVEFDRGFCRALRKTLSGSENVEPVCQDILKVDLRKYAQQCKLKALGNLPYYITTPILEYLIKNKAYITGALLMVQKELGERLVARPASRLYGAITCYLKFYSRVEFRSVVKRTSFFPMPDVDSVLLDVEILDRPPVNVHDEKMLFGIIRTSFNQRRKTLLSSLSHKEGLGFDRRRVEDVLSRAGVSGSRRPESLSLDEFARIANEFV